eukprot:SAG11_NODE_373_length_10031_cov_37.400020_16_plen_59_part_00
MELEQGFSKPVAKVSEVFGRGFFMALGLSGKIRGVLLNIYTFSCIFQTSTNPGRGENT